MNAEIWRSWGRTAPPELLRAFDGFEAGDACGDPVPRSPSIELELHEPGHYDVELRLEEGTCPRS